MREIYDTLDHMHKYTYTLHTKMYVYITHTHIQIFGSLVSVQGNLSFIGNNAERSDGGALYISEFGQVKLYSGAQVEFINNTGRYRGEWGQGREEWGQYTLIGVIY